MNITAWTLKLETGSNIYIKAVSASQPAGPGDSGGKYIVVVVHGGPGLTDHKEIFQGLCPLSEHDSVSHLVFYDQLGCGQSDKPYDAARYSMEASVSELRQVVENVGGAMVDSKLQAVGSEDFGVWRAGAESRAKVVILGYSWGGQVVLQFLISSGREMLRGLLIEGCVTSNTPLNEPTYELRQRVLRANLDESVREFLEEEEAQHEHDVSTESLVYRTLIGTSETRITGSMRDWSVLSRLKDPEPLDSPCLLLAGEYDTAPPNEYCELGQLAYGDRQVTVLPAAEHAPFYAPSEQRQEYFGAIDRFLESL